MYYGYDQLGSYCHWCGNELPRNKQRPRTGTHVFCDSKCKMAHHRAFKKYQEKRVTPASGSEAFAARRPGRKSNGTSRR